MIQKHIRLSKAEFQSVSIFKGTDRGDRGIGVAINRGNRAVCLIDSAITLVNAVLRHDPSGHGTEPTGCVRSMKLPSS
jgi:hypothetical protein